MHNTLLVLIALLLVVLNGFFVAAEQGLGWVGAPDFADLLDPLFVQMNIAEPALIHSISFTFAFATIFFLPIVMGELAPKSLTIRHPESIGDNCKQEAK